MKATLVSALSAMSALSLAASLAQAQTLTVVPAAFSAAEGNSSSSSLFQSGAASLQAYYSEAFLADAGITPGVVITGIAYRRNTGGATGPAGDTTIDEYNIFMSQSFDTSASMTTTFADNAVGDQTQVYSAPITFEANSFPGGAAPNDFGPVIEFSEPYAYAGGSLLIEIRRSARTGNTASFNTDVDNTAATQAGTRWLFNTTSNTAITGTFVNGGQIFQLRYEDSAAPCPGDYNADDTVDLADLIAFNNAWQPNIGLDVPPGTAGDYDSNGVVDLADLIAFNVDWQPAIGQGCP